MHHNLLTAGSWGIWIESVYDNFGYIVDIHHNLLDIHHSLLMNDEGYKQKTDLWDVYLPRMIRSTDKSDKLWHQWGSEVPMHPC